MKTYRLVLNEGDRSRTFQLAHKDDAEFFYGVIVARVCNPNSKFFGAGVQLFQDDLCIREIARHDSESCAAT